MERLSARVKGLARDLGFDLVGVARVEAIPETRFLREWVARGYAGAMGWIPRRLAEREDPGLVLPGARSVIAVGLVYDTEPCARSEPQPGDETKARAAGAACARSEPQPGDETKARAAGAACARSEPQASVVDPVGRVARYAGGDDYHEVLGARLRSLAEALPDLAGHDVRARAYVDTGPVAERAWAAAAGLGWIGRNTCLINPSLGSYSFLGVVLTDLELVPDAREPDHCGSCRACLDACPTGAFPEPYVLDATRCLAYTTIELPEDAAIPEALREGQGDWVFGCDVCQEVCPWNARSRRRVPGDPLGLRTRLEARPEWRAPRLADLLALDEAASRERTRRSALRRAGHRGLLRSALVAAGNAGDPALAEALRRHAEGPDPMLAEHARWALTRLKGRESG
jgi:epoxyqueuosine reductase